MNMKTSMLRQRIVYGLAVVAAMLLGLGSREYAGQLPPFIVEHFGDALWASMIYFGFRMLWPTMKLTRSTVLAVVFCFGIEASQLYQAEWIQVIRGTTLGALILGKGFLVVDLVRYSAGILISVVVDHFLLARKGRIIK
ncbi:ribosomal maturation YjgA family protein [Paenibacillus radicis (ex Gao et al. 2016)]|uniref:DUF2809 domain-containing protein n=1 Tax=Paenibacillus radicis (ex Gao et al. 2016) TaxID=1737354 RepID=A0A917M6D8_9BACL|nr:DUF2809 domain-containing protein [Paenibacillus radicis (ex Gao et al. 2016)]GGG81845.1 hypothetical protein GCM10010918_43940 [Paenibacillus radicis (ex Gao et al. 2016)]